MSTTSRGRDATIRRVDAAAYTIPTDAPESDGTIAWSSTTIVVVTATAGDHTGIGFSYADRSAADIVNATLAPLVADRSALDVMRAYVAMRQACRNIGNPGIASGAVSAVDIALWDLKARLLGVPLVSLLGSVRDGITLYGSGGFTSYSLQRLEQQLGGWARDGFTAVKMKIGRDPSADVERVRVARGAIGAGTALYVDANGAYTAKEALVHAAAIADQQIAWFEEPVSSDDLDGLRFVREHVPAPTEIAAGEYGYDVVYFRKMLDAASVDVLQADATRCGGISGFLAAGALCDGWGVPLSAHTAPTIHAHVCCAVPRVRNLEYFHDHVRIEQMLFDGVLTPIGGELRPDRSRDGLGIDFKHRDAQRFAA